MTVPYTFATATTTLPLSQLDANFSALGSSANVAYTAPITNAVLRTSSSKMSDIISVKDFGAIGDGVTNDTSALSLMSSSTSQQVFVPAGTYLISGNLTIASYVVFEKGAVFNIANGVTVAFSGGLSAEVFQIFNCSGTGKVTINSQYTTVGYPEWWGAVTNSAATDCSTAINNCIVACVITQLQAAVYYTTNTIYHSTAGRTVLGASQAFVGTAGGSEIRNQNASNTIYQIGPNSYGGSGTLQNSNVLKWILINRSVAPLITSANSGVLIQFTVWTTLESVFSSDSVFGFNIRGNASTDIFNCLAAKYTVGTGAADKFYGFYANGDTNIGFAGGNASLTLNGCSALNFATWSASVDYQGLVLLGTYGWSDVFVMNFETKNLGYGINMVGNGNTSGTFDQQNEDVRIYNPILDLCEIAGISFYTISKYGSIQVIGGYSSAGLNGTSPTGIIYSSSFGSISVQQMEIYCKSSANANGVIATNSSSILHKNNTISECTKFAVELDGVTNSLFEDQIRNYSVVSTSPAIYVHNTCTRLVVRAMVEGKTNAFSQGYELNGTTTTYSEFACSGLDQSCINFSKLRYNATPITTVGTFGTNNYAWGVMN